MKVVIINSPLFREINPLYDEDSLPPLGLGYIATNLKAQKIEVKIIDAVDQRIPLTQLMEIIRNENPDVVATNIFTTNYELVKEMIEGLSGGIHVIVGGLSTKELYKQIVSWESPNQIDVVTGDGELIIVDLVKGTVQQEPLYESSNRRVYKVDNESKYLVQDISTSKLDRSFFLNEPVVHPMGFVEANIVTSRGCIYNCTFCAAARSLNLDSRIREMSEDSIIEELSSIQRQFPSVNSIRVLDDLFLKKKESVELAARVFSKFPFQWRSMAHVMTFHSVDETLLQSLQRSGCHELFVGIESGSPGILKQINKTSNINTIINNLSKVLNAGINIKGYFIYGFPGETKADMDMTFCLAKQLKEIAIKAKVNFRTSVFQYRPYHASQIYHDLYKNDDLMHVKAVKPNEKLSSLVGRLQFNFHTENLSSVDINEVHNYIYRTIDLNDGEIFGQLATKSM